MSTSTVVDTDQTIDHSEFYEQLNQCSTSERTEIFLNYIQKIWPNIRLIGSKDNYINLKNIDLSRLTIQSQFNHLIIQNPPWWNRSIEEVCLKDITILYADFTDSNLDNVDFSNSVLDHGIFDQSEMRYTNFNNSYARCASFRDANLSFANLTAAKVDGSNFSDAVLRFSQLEDAKAANTKFVGSNLEYTNARGAILTDSALSGSILIKADLSNAQLEDTNLTESNLSEAILENAKFQRSILERINLRDAKIDGADFSEACFYDTHLEDINFMNTKIRHISIKGAYLNKTLLTIENLNKKIKEDLDNNYFAARLAYIQLRNNFDGLGYYDAASYIYRRERIMGRKEMPSQIVDLWFHTRAREAVLCVLDWILSYIIDILCGYGESFKRVFLWILLILGVLGPVIIYASGGLLWDHQSLQAYYSYDSPLKQFLYAYLLYVLYTLDTLTTANFSQLKPDKDSVRIFSGILAFLGIFLIGLLGFVAGNRIRRF